MTIAGKLRYPAATENQMAYAIVRSNPNAFSVRTKGPEDHAPILNSPASTR